MFCTKCGNQINEGQRFCTSCGIPVKGTERSFNSEIKQKALSRRGFIAPEDLSVC